MKYQSDEEWKLEKKKERNRWIWTMVFLLVLVLGYFGFSYHQKYGETTVLALAKRSTSNFSLESYKTGTISFHPDNSEDKKEITLSKDDVKMLMNPFENNSVKGNKNNIPIENPYYIVEIISDNPSNTIVFFIERNKSTEKDSIVMIHDSVRFTALKHTVLSKDLYNGIANLVEEKAPL